MSEPNKRSMRHLDVSQLSPSMKARNPHLFEPPADFGQMAARQPGEPSEVPAKKVGRRRKQPNGTEAQFGRIVAARRDEWAKVKTIRFEGLSLRWGFTDTAPPMVYTPDWVITMESGKIICVEVKGPHIFDRDIVRFKGCRAGWPEFTFQMWQKPKGLHWIQLH